MALRRQIAEYSIGWQYGPPGRSIEFSDWKYYREIRYLYNHVARYCVSYIATTLITPLTYPKSFTIYVFTIIVVVIIVIYYLSCYLSFITQFSRSTGGNRAVRNNGDGGLFHRLFDREHATDSDKIEYL